MLSALAEATARVELGTIVLCTAFRNPALLAKMADAVQEVSGGRLILGLGAGWHEPEFDAFGYPFDQLGVKRVQATIAKGNKAARKFVERLGFRYEGLARFGFSATQHAAVYSMLREECRWLHEQG
jgi:alkanesulfonate monooxygenase SsuD/methylene tetrahydromethanopterin reductase-like flavin-dependent oxidoreductase (luciferase family)